MNWTATRLVRPIAGLLLATAALPAQADVAPGAMPTSYAGSKTEAILGGSSALAALLMRQAAVQPFAAPVPAAAPLPAIRAPFAVQPQSAIVPASVDRPDVFNSVALPVRRTPLDGRWSRVARSGIGGSAAAYATGLGTRAESARIEAINTYVNQRVAFVDDSRQYGVADRWTAAADTLARGRGDCEDYAIAKMAMLRRAGFAERDLYLVILKDLVRRADHAVLVVRSEGRFRVLDNGTDRILDSSDVRDYRPILTFSVARAFTHGYRRQIDPIAAPTMTLAKAEPMPVPAVSDYQTASAAPFSGLLPSMALYASQP